MCSGLERIAARLAAERADDAQRQTITDAARKSLDCARGDDSAGFAEWDMVFHTAVADAAGNRLLAKTVGESVTLAFTLRSRDVPTPEDSVHCGRQHVRVARAIKAGDPAVAGQQMLDHVSDMAKFVLAAAD